MNSIKVENSKYPTTLSSITNEFMALFGEVTQVYFLGYSLAHRNSSPSK